MGSAHSKSVIDKALANEERARRRYGTDRDWVDANRETLLQEYPESWIAVRGRKVVASSDALDELIRSMRRKRLRPEDSVIEHLTAHNVAMLL